MSFAHRFAYFHMSDIRELKWSGLVSKLRVKRGRLVIMPLAILHLKFFGHIAHLIEKYYSWCQGNIPAENVKAHR